MLTIQDGYAARWHGREFEARPDGDQVRIYQTQAEDGFDQVGPGRYLRLVPLSDVEDLAYVRTICSWKGEPFIVLAQHESWLRVEYTGGKAPVARAMGLDEFDYGVYQGWAPTEEVTDLREHRI